MTAVSTKVWCRACSRFLGDMVLDGTVLYFPLCQKCGERAEAILAKTNPKIDKAALAAHNSV